MKKIIILISIFYLAGCMSYQNGKDQRIYKYFARVGNFTDGAIYLGQGNYFFQDLGSDKIEKTHEFPSIYGYPTVTRMGWGETVQSLFSEGKMPDSVMLKWFSPLENKVWLTRMTLDSQLLEQLKTYELQRPYAKKEYIRLFTPDDTFSFVINYGYNGYTAVWLNKNGQAYLVGHTKGFEYQEKGWRYYLQGDTRQEAIDYVVKHLEPAIKTKYKQGQLDYSGKLWERSMRRYHWNIIDGDYFTIGDNSISFTNGEDYYIYENKGNPFRKTHAAPNEMSIVVKNRNDPNHAERIYVKFDKEDALNKFEALSQGDPNTELKLKMDVNEDLTDVTFTLYGNGKAVEIKYEEAKLLNLMLPY